MDTSSLVKCCEEQFVELYVQSPKPIIIWDTCAILEVMRFFIQGKEFNTNTFCAIQKLQDAIQQDIIYSISSDLCLTELNENWEIAHATMDKAIESSDNAHKVAIDIRGLCKNKSHGLYPLAKSGMSTKLNDIAEQISQKTLFIEATEQLAFSALTRVRQKDPPAQKKQEFKDCAIWETALSVCKRISALNQVPYKIVFMTVNVADFCNKNDKTLPFIPKLLMEAATNGFTCCRTYVDAVNVLGL